MRSFGKARRGDAAKGRGYAKASRHTPFLHKEVRGRFTHRHPVTPRQRGATPVEHTLNQEPIPTTTKHHSIPPIPPPHHLASQHSRLDLFQTHSIPFVSSTAPCGDGPNLPHHAPPRQAGICRTMRICWTPSRPMFTGLPSEMRQTTQEFVRFSKPRFRIPNLGMAYAKHRTSNVSPWGDRTSSVRC